MWRPSLPDLEIPEAGPATAGSRGKPSAARAASVRDRLLNLSRRPGQTRVRRGLVDSLWLKSATRDTKSAGHTSLITRRDAQGYRRFPPPVHGGDDLAYDRPGLERRQAEIRGDLFCKV